MSSASRKTKRGAGDPPSRPSGSKQGRAGASGAKPETQDETNDQAREAQQAGLHADLSFEAALEQLQAIVDRLEGGELELEDAVEAFAEGARLTRRCSEALSAAERRIEVLTQQGGEWLSRPFDPDAAVGERATEDDEDDEDFGDEEDWDEAGS